MIPKKIHLCWLSNEPYPDKIQQCLRSWKDVMPDYEVKLWSAETFDIENSVPYVKEAFASRKWAFVADYIRLYALYTEGGIYLDSDVLVLKRFDDLLDHNFISSMEFHPFQVEQQKSYRFIDEDGKRNADCYIDGIQIQAAIMGAEQGCPFVKEILEWYEDRRFIKKDGSLSIDVIAPQIYARVAEKRGFRYKDEDQLLDGDVMIYRSEIFAGNKREATLSSYAIHFCENSWVPKSTAASASKYWKFFCFLCRQKFKTIFRSFR